jgi:hypothetical protein
MTVCCTGCPLDFAGTVGSGDLDSVNLASVDLARAGGLVGHTEKRDRLAKAKITRSWMTLFEIGQDPILSCCSGTGDTSQFRYSAFDLVRLGGYSLSLLPSPPSIREVGASVIQTPEGRNVEHTLHIHGAREVHEELQGAIAIVSKE